MIHIAKPEIGEEEKKAVEAVLSSGMIAQGPKVKEFEKEFSKYIGTEYAVAASNGTTALHLALLASGIEPGDEVITTPFSFIATGNSILYCGAKPVFADIDERTFNIDPLRIKEKITEKTKALLIVPLYGQPCQMEEILQISEKYNIKLIEDACQSHGAVYKDKRVGSFGDGGVFSFYPTKNMTTGEGGMITTNDKEVAEKARLLREHGMKVRYYHDMLGYNYRMTDIAAAIGIEQLKKLDDFNNKRQDNAKKLDEYVDEKDGLLKPFVLPESRHVFHQYTIRVTEEFHLTRDEVVKKLVNAGVGTGIYYPVPIHKQSFYDKMDADDLSVSEKMADEVISLPVRPGLSQNDIRHIGKTITDL